MAVTELQQQNMQLDEAETNQALGMHNDIEVYTCDDNSYIYS